MDRTIIRSIYISGKWHRFKYNLVILMAANAINWSLQRAMDPTTKSNKLHELSISHDAELRLAAASNPSTSTYTLREIIRREDPETPAHVFSRVITDESNRIFGETGVMDKDQRVLNAARENLKKRIEVVRDLSRPIETIQKVLADERDKEISQTAAVNLVIRLLSGELR